MMLSRVGRALVATGGILFLTVSAGYAQEGGAITGQVTDATTGAPLAGVQVYVQGTRFGTITQSNGRYRLESVPTGARSVTVQMLGYGQVTQSVTVAAGQAAILDFALERAAIALDEVVVTAVGAQRVRELGNAVSSIAAAEVTEVAPITSMAELLQGRTAGVQVFSSSGTPGMGSRIRIRGANSMSLSNEPLVYVDGIRVNTSDDFSLFSGGQEPSRLDDINPEDIESIEIVKGPAAATLYGTEAANGVVRITTKRGTPGATRWNIWLEGGVTEDPHTYPLNYAGVDPTGGIDVDDPPDGEGDFERSCTLDNQARGRCQQARVSSYQVLNDPDLSPLQTGIRRQYGLSVSGGVNNLSYYISGEMQKEVGPYKLPGRDRQDLEGRGLSINEFMERPQNLERASIRANLNAEVARNATVALNTGFVTSDLSFTGNDNNSFGFLPSGYFGGAFPEDGWEGAWGFQRPAQLFGRDLLQHVERFTSSLTTTWTPREWLQARVTGGLDYTKQLDVSWFARDLGVPGPDFGEKDSNFRDIYEYTLDGVLTGNFDLTPMIASRTSVGFQYFRDFTHGTEAFGEDLPPGAGSIGTAALTQSDEFYRESKTAGVFIEQQFGLNDRLFVTAAVRADDNSTFGKDYDIIYYPKASLSWMASEEPFFPAIPALDRLRLRVAAGRSGLQPGSNAALQTLDADAITAPNDATVVGVVVDELGNPVLEPEQTSEIEAGFDAGVLDDRIGIDLTYYHKRSKAALVDVDLPPSLGADPSRWINVGEVRNSGWEVGINAIVLNTERAQFDLLLSGSWNRNELIELGEGIEPIGNTVRHQEGHPLGGRWNLPIVGWEDANGDGILRANEVQLGDSSVFIGPSMPERQITLGGNLTLFERVGVYALLDHRGDFYVHNLTEQFRCNFRLCRGLVDPTTPLDEQAKAVAAVYHPAQTAYGFVEKGDFWKLRELSVSYAVPSEWAAYMRASRASITLTGRNLATWTDYSGLDPEINDNGSSTNFGFRDFLTQPPIRTWTVRLNLGF